MRPRWLFIIFLYITVWLASGHQVMAEEIRVAVASNFNNAITELASRFQTATGYRVGLSFGSTGKHYAQIRHGAPFDLFFAADAYRPQLLEDEGVAVPGSRFTYALGKLVLWSPQPDLVDQQGAVLHESTFRYLAMANPRLAPYGRAAEEVLQAVGLGESLPGRIVRGENIGQTLQFIRSGNAELGFVAYAQIKRPGQPVPGSWWDIPPSLYSPIVQQAVLLKEGPVARAFFDYMQSDEAREIIRTYGYDTP